MDIEQHCLKIIQSPRIRNRFVILCEGETLDPERNSPSAYAKNERLPDANFYKKCLPRCWTERTPVFVNSGSRSQVIQTYQSLPTIHAQNPEISRLTPDKTFALLDIDLQSEALVNYQFASIDEAFQDLFTHGRVNLDRLSTHKIWFTGLIHKEAYFLAPELQGFFDDLANVSHYEGCAYQNNPLNLNHVYQNMIQDINTDQDLATHWPRAKERIMHCPGLELDCPEKLQQSWQTQWSKAMDDFDRTHQLIDALLSIRKVKPYWEQIHPVNEPTTENCSEDWRSFREDIALEIGRQVYSRQEGKPHEHLACFFKYLYQLEFGQ
jgi:hypothetical protein